MNLRTHRLRRVAAAAALGVGTVGGVVGFAAAGTAGASTTGATIHASSAPSVVSTGSGQKAGTLKLTLPAGGTGGAITLVAAPATGGTVKWTSETVSSSGGTALVSTVTTTTLTITAVKATGTAETITITGITYTTSGAHGTITVTPSTTPYVFKPTDVVNAVAPAKAATPATTTALTATSVAKVVPGVNGQKAGTWTISITGAKGTGWAKTDTVTITVLTHAKNNCGATGYVLFTGTPTAKVTSSTGTSTTPTVTTSVSHGTDCTVAGDHDMLTVTFTNSGTFNATKGAITIVVSGVKYNVGTTTVGGKVEVAFTELNGKAVAASTAPANADVTTLYVSANTPPVTLAKDAYDAAISPVKIFSDSADAVSGYVCMTLSAAATWNPAATATAKQTGGATGKTTPKVTYETPLGTATTKAATATFAVFHVVTEVTKTLPVTYTVSGLRVDAATAASKVTVKDHGTSDCAAGGTLLGTATAFTIGATSTQIYGATADATAAAELEHVFTTTTTNCPGTGNGTRPVILARDTTYPDALASQYLAGRLGTGTLLTPTKSLSAATMNALRIEGISHVFVVGGPLAVSTTVVKQLQTTEVYQCGGTAPFRNGTGKTEDITVTRIYGTTEYTTAEKIAEYELASTIGTAKLPLAYAGVNKTGGNGVYNATAGMGSAAPKTAGTLRTAILATGETFQDAMSASALSYNNHFPILLTEHTALSSQAQSAFSSLGIQQVIVMGGQDAISNTVVKTLTSMGISVLRVAGVDYTDTAVEAANLEHTKTAELGLDWTGTTVAVARGTFFSDGIAGAVLNHAGAEVSLLETESPSTVGTYLTTFLKSAKTKYGIATLLILGGPDAVHPAIVAQMETDLNG